MRWDPGAAQSRMRKIPEVMGDRCHIRDVSSTPIWRVQRHLSYTLCKVALCSCVTLPVPVMRCPDLRRRAMITAAKLLSSP